jgi:hypothetical protein
MIEEIEKFCPEEGTSNLLQTNIDDMAAGMENRPSIE